MGREHFEGAASCGSVQVASFGKAIAVASAAINLA
jgi:hypothetical protein